MSLRTTVVGSWWPLPEHEQDLDRYHAGQLSAEEGEAVLNRATTAAIAEQRALGLDEWTGGEYFTRNFIFHIHEMLTGLEIDKPERSNVFDYDDMAHVRIVGEVDAPNGLGYTAAFKRESRLSQQGRCRVSSGDACPRPRSGLRDPAPDEKSDPHR